MSRLTLKTLIALLIVLSLAGCKGPTQTAVETVEGVAAETAVLGELTSTFTVKDALGLIAPATEATVSAEPLLQWQNYPDAASYQVLVRYDVRSND